MVYLVKSVRMSVFIKAGYKTNTHASRMKLVLILGICVSTNKLLGMLIRKIEEKLLLPPFSFVPFRDVDIGEFVVPGNAT